jgi:hypothetical protein
MAQNSQAAPQGAGAGAGPGLANQQGPVGRVVVLNALPLNALPRAHLELDVLPVSINDLASWIQRRLAEGYEVLHFVRHASTIQALRSIGIPLPEQPNSGLYTYRPDDLLVVVTLRTPPRGQEQQNIRPEDLEVWIVTVL